MAKTYEQTSQKTEKQARDAIVDEFRMWNNFERGVIGAYDFPAPVEIGGKEATVRFVFRGQPKQLMCDSQRTYRQNLVNVWLAIEATRLNEKRGIGELMRSMYLALDGPAPEHWATLGLRPGATADAVREAYRLLAQKHHPDKGGDAELMARLNTARDKALAEVGA